DDANAALDLDRRGHRVEAEDPHLAGRRAQQAGEALDRGRLAGAVGPEKPVEAAGGNLEIDAVHRALRPEHPRESARLDREFHQHGIVCQHDRMNRLARERSPYLLQHANNPVDWYPWGDEAFAKARSEDKPIFLSI